MITTIRTVSGRTLATEFSARETAEAIASIMDTPHVLETEVLPIEAAPNMFRIRAVEIDQETDERITKWLRVTKE